MNGSDPHSFIVRPPQQSFTFYTLRFTVFCSLIFNIKPVPGRLPYSIAHLLIALVDSSSADPSGFTLGRNISEARIALARVPFGLELLGPGF